MCKQWSSSLTGIDQLRTAWNDKCRNTSRISIGETCGLSKVLMICEGHNHPYSFVFATTAPNWGTYLGIREWCWNARRGRLSDGEYEENEARYERFVEIVSNQHILAAGGLQDPLSLRLARMAAIDHTPDEIKYNHKGELARSIGLQPQEPNGEAMVPRSRCFKCQALYRWFIPNETPEYGDHLFEGSSCAETVCNFFCLRVRPVPNVVAIADDTPAMAAAPVAFAPTVRNLPVQTVTAPYWPPNLNVARPWILFQENQNLTAEVWEGV